MCMYMYSNQFQSYIYKGFFSTHTSIIINKSQLKGQVTHSDFSYILFNSRNAE